MNMKCPQCGSEDIEVRLGFIIPVDLVKDADGVLRGELNERVVPDFASFYCNHCHAAGEIYEGNGTTQATVYVAVEWQPRSSVVFLNETSIH